MVELSITGDLTRMERSLTRLAHEQVPFAAAQALNDVARGARDHVNAHMGSVFDRPNPFTRRAVVAPRELAASKSSLTATVTLQPKQAKYLLHEEIGGTRSPAENTDRPASALLMPRAGVTLDQFGGVPRALVPKLKAQMARAGKRRAKRRARAAASAGVFYAPAGGRLAGGFWRRMPDHSLRQVLGFATAAHYTARFHYHDQVRAHAQAAWLGAFLPRLHAAIASAR